ncbi:MAG: class I SAM-dependent methyltransferase [Kiritimatiellae bacterium]|nr:class I SAM-dependent methyltransferase [Kiritimatiellia bacterium]
MQSKKVLLQNFPLALENNNRKIVKASVSGFLAMLDRPEEYDKMALAERELWWYRALHELTYRAIRKAGFGQSPSILDAGCGTGGLLLYLRQHGLENLRGLDIAPKAVEWCRRRGLQVDQESLLLTAKLYPPDTLDIVTSLDTLYFFDQEQQAEVIAQFRTVLRPRGLLVLNLPALNAFRGIHDLAVGIRRRFTKADVDRLLPCEDWTVIECMFWPFLLSPGIYVQRFCQRLKLHKSTTWTVTSDVALPSPWLNKLFLCLTKYENRLLRHRPWGSSLFVTARKKA